MKENIFVIIAAYNEENNISSVIDETKRYCKNIIVIDDGSKDKTYQTAKKKKVKVLQHIVNLGKGAAIKTGCDLALKKGATILLLVDADGQHEPKDIPRFLKSLKNKDIVFGYRKFTRKMPFVYRLGNNFINFTTRLLYNIDLKDTQCGYRALRAETYKKVRWNASSYSMESEMIANTGRYHLRYDQVGIKTLYKEKYKGTTILDGMKIVLNLILWRFRR